MGTGWSGWIPGRGEVVRIEGYYLERDHYKDTPPQPDDPPPLDGGTRLGNFQANDGNKEGLPELRIGGCVGVPEVGRALLSCMLSGGEACFYE